MSVFPLEKDFIIGVWLEALFFGFFSCLFFGSLYVHLTLRNAQGYHSRMIFYTSILMFIIATIHASINCYRVIQGYVIRKDNPAAYMAHLASWHQVVKDILLITQELLGDAVAIYRAWIIWRRKWKPVFIPILLFIVSIITGFTICGLFATQSSESTVFDPRLQHWIIIFNIVALIQAGMTTGLMAYRIWKVDRQLMRSRTKRTHFFPFIRILVESAAFQFLTIAILIGLYMAKSDAEFIMLELVTPVVGIVFSAITIRVTLHSQSIQELHTGENLSTALNDFSDIIHDYDAP